MYRILLIYYFVLAVKRFPLFRLIVWSDGTIQCQVVLLVWIMLGQGNTMLAVGAGGGSSDIFFLSSIIFLFLLPLSGVDGWMT